MASQEVFKVPTTRLGKSGLRISKIILGCMSYGDKRWGGASWVLEEDDAMKHFEQAYKLGIFTWDTADVYSNGRSEELVGMALKKLGIPREKVVILTKTYFPVSPDPNQRPSPPTTDEYSGLENEWGLNRKHIFASVKASLERLGTDYIDVLQCHRFDYNTPIEETMQALHDVVKAGYVRYIGMSSCHAYQFHAMQNYAIANKLTPFISMQDLYTPIYREEEREMFPTLNLFGVGSIPWSPLARGFLTRPYDNTSSVRIDTDPLYKALTGFNNPNVGQANIAVNAAVKNVAEKRGISMAQATLAWVLANKTVSAPIVGSTKLESLVELAHATKIELAQDEIDEISAAYVPRGTFGHA